MNVRDGERAVPSAHHQGEPEAFAALVSGMRFEAHQRGLRKREKEPFCDARCGSVGRRRFAAVELRDRPEDELQGG